MASLTHVLKFEGLAYKLSSSIQKDDIYCLEIVIMNIV